MVTVANDIVDETATACLMICSGPEAGKQFPLDKSGIILGRSRRCHIQLDDVRVSDRHARIVLRDGFHFITDLDSSNGTWVNAQRVQEVMLQHGDFIQLGETTFKYLSADDQYDQQRRIPSAAGGRRDLDALAVPIEVIQQALAGHQFPTAPATNLTSGVGADEDESLSFTEILAQLGKAIDFYRPYKWMMLGCIVAGAVVGAASFWFSPPDLRAKFEIRLMPEPITNPVEVYYRNNLEFFSTPTYGFKNDELLKKTLRALGEEPTPWKINSIQQRLWIVQSDKSKVDYLGEYKCAYDEDPIRFLNTHLNIYLESSMNSAIQIIQTEADLLRKKLKDTAEELAKIEGQLEEFRIQNVDRRPEYQATYHQDWMNLQTKQRELRAQIMALSADLRHAKAKVRGERPLVVGAAQRADPYRGEQERLHLLKAKLASEGKGPEHPLMVQADNELARLQELATKNDKALAAGATTDPVHDRARDNVYELEATIQGVQAELALSEKETKKLAGVVAELPELETKYNEIGRHYKQVNNLYDRTYRRLETVEVQLEVERAAAAARYQILSPPRVEWVSRKTQIINRAIPMGVVGLIFGFVLATFLSIRKRRQNAEAEASVTGVESRALVPAGRGHTTDIIVPKS